MPAYSRFATLFLLLTTATAAHAQTAPLSSSLLLQGPTSIRPAAAAEPSCALRPERVGMLKVGLAAGQAWSSAAGLRLPVSLGYERRLFAGLSVLATFTSIYDPWQRTPAGSPAAPSLTQFDVTTGLRYYLPIRALHTETREEFSGPYVGVLASRTFRSELRGDATSPADYTYRLHRHNQLVAGYQLLLGARGFLDAAAGLQLGRGSQATRRLAPTAGLTVGLFF